MLLSNQVASWLWCKSSLIMNIFCLILGSQSIQLDNIHKWAVVIARYVTYILIIKGSHEACVWGCKTYSTKDGVNMFKIWKQTKTYLLVFVISIAVLVYFQQKILGEEFLLLFIGYLITKYPEIEQKSTVINYGMGMACSFFEGYLVHMIPSDGSHFVGFQENINHYEAQQGVIFPVKRLFIVITKSLYCPPDLKFFNKEYTELPYLEACQFRDGPYGAGQLQGPMTDNSRPSTNSHLDLCLQNSESLRDVEKDVAGVKNRTYRNSAYKIYRKNRPPVYLAAECATPLHTLHKVLQKKSLYEELAEVDPTDLVNDFCRMLRSIIQKSPDCRDKCELVYFDDTDPNQNLADVLLDKIREIESNFEYIIAKPR